MAHLKSLGLPIALAAALSAPPFAAADDVEKPVTRQDVKDLKSAQEKSFKEMMEAIGSLREQLRAVDGIRKDVDGLKATVQSINTLMDLSTQTLKERTSDLAELRAQLRKMGDDLEKARGQITAHSARCDGLTEELTELRKRLADGSRQAARITDGAGTGTVRLYNTSDRMVSIILNERGPAYRLNPGETVVLNQQPVGPVTYEVLGLGAPYRRTTTVKADDPLEIEVYDLARGLIKIPPKPAR